MHQPFFHFYYNYKATVQLGDKGINSPNFFMLFMNGCLTFFTGELLSKPQRLKLSHQQKKLLKNHLATNLYLNRSTIEYFAMQFGVELHKLERWIMRKRNELSEKDGKVI